MNNQEIFFNFLEENFPDRAGELQERFTQYYDILVEANSKINLFSRKMPLEDIWTTHFYDSLIPYKLFTGKRDRILDFGTGGGLPGIPLAILFPESRVNLLDGTKKKIMAIDEMLDVLQLENVNAIWSRVEEYFTINSYDYIVSRSVKIIPEFKPFLMDLLQPKGKLILYKSKILDDVMQFKNYKINDYSNEILGTRNIIEIRHE